MPYINKFIGSTTVLGPGARSVIWFQGCEKSCKACINPIGQKIGGGDFYSCDELFDMIVANKNIIGVTISGGEPFLQYDDLFYLVSRLKEQTALDIMLYSGYTFDELVVIYG